MSDGARARVRSALTAPQRALLRAGLGLAVFVLANTLYLLANRLAEDLGSSIFAVTEFSLPVFYQVMILSHTGAGLLLSALGAAFVLWHLGPVWKRRKPRTLVSGVLSIAALMGLAVTGLFILTAAASRANAWAWWLHVGLAASLPAAYLAHRLLAMRRAPRAAVGRFGLATASAAALLVVVHLALPRGPQLTPETLSLQSADYALSPGSAAFRRIYLAEASVASPARFVPANDVPVQSPFFPAAATTTTGGLLPERLLLQEFMDRRLPREEFERHGFVVSARIGAEGCERCHQDIVAQWAVSAHRFSSFNNPFYEAAIDLLREEADRENPLILAHLAHAGIEKERLPLVRSQWCSSCHDPALMIPGRMNQPIDRESAAAQAGLTCLACHNIDAIHNNTGNGAYNQADEQESPYLFADAYYGAFAWLHDAALKARPAVHMRQRLKPFFRTSEFCGACHKVSLDVPLNSYRWVRGQNEYDNWHDSGTAHNAARTFYLPPARRVCQDCHMPLEPAPLGDLAAKNGMVRSHRFLAANNALPFLRGDADSVRRVEQFLRDFKLRIDVFAAVRPGATPAEDETIYGLDRAQLTVAPGERVRAEVVVRNLDVGHTFPGGTNDSNESWIELTVLDERGRVLAQSGAVGADGHVDEHAHFFRVVMVDQSGRRVFRRDPHNFLAPLYANVIGPGTARVAHYEFVAPPELAGRPLTLRARLLWRKFERAFTEFAFHRNRRGFVAFDDVPELPIVEIAAAEARVSVGSADSGRPVARGPTADVRNVPEHEWQRMNDYGIALLLEGHTRGAMEAFRLVAEISPQRPDGWRNYARAAHAEGNLVAALAALRKAEALAPGDARTAWMWGQALAEDGRYAEAAAAYQRVLEAFPGDRAAWRELSIAYYRDRRFAESLEAGAQVLAIDPEDRVAHYYRMLAFKALGRPDDAERARLAYEKYQIDESAQQFTQALRLASPADNLESQAIHAHELTLAPSPEPHLAGLDRRPDEHAHD